MCALSVVRNYNCVGNNGATAASTIMDTFKLVELFERMTFYVNLYSATCGFEDDSLVLTCEQKITLQYNESICLEPCLSCKIKLRRCINISNPSLQCCPANSISSCSLGQTGCVGSINMTCEAIFTVTGFENSLTNFSIDYQNNSFVTSMYIVAKTVIALITISNRCYTYFAEQCCQLL